MGHGADPLENGLTIALPWLVVLVLALVQAAIQLPRDPLSEPDRLLVVGRPLTAECTIVENNSTKSAGKLSSPALFDLAAFDQTWLSLYGGGRVGRAEIGFQPEQLQGRVDTKAIETGSRELDVLVSTPQPADLAPQLLRVDVQAYRIVPPATWDTYFYRVDHGRPEPLLVLRGEPALLERVRDPAGREAFSHEPLRRRNLQYVWTGETLQLATIRTRTGHWGYLFTGAFTALPWWAWLLVALPVGGLLLGSTRAVLAVGAASRQGRTANAEMVGLVLALAILGAGIAAVIVMRQWQLLDRVTGLLAPVVLVLSVNAGLVTTAKMAQAEAGQSG